jgi:VRR-NUC domain
MTGRSAMRAAQGARDANHADVQRWYEDLYCLVFDTHALGCGFPDLLVGIPTRMGRVLALVEVKTSGGTLRPSQETFIRQWGSGSVEIVQTREDVFAHVERVRLFGPRPPSALPALNSYVGSASAAREPLP